MVTTTKILQPELPGFDEVPVVEIKPRLPFDPYREEDGPKNFEEWKAWRLQTLKDELDAFCLDSELYDVLHKLNSRDFFSYMSCAGHSRIPGKTGYVEFLDDYVGEDCNEIIRLLESHGLKDIEFHNGEKSTVNFAAIGNQYTPLHDNRYMDFDFCYYVPLKDKCPTCGDTDLWLWGEAYTRFSTMEWLCKRCEPKPFDVPFTFKTPEIMAKLESLPKLKTWDVELFDTDKAVRIEAENHFDICYKLGLLDDGYGEKYHIQRVK